MKTISVIIPTYTNTEGLQRCVRSVLLHTDLPEVEIIVVANGAPEAVKSLKSDRIKVIWKDKPLGYAKAVNLGLREAQGEVVILLNDDAELLEQDMNHWIMMLHEPFLKDEKVGISAPVIEYNPFASSRYAQFFCVMISRKVIDEIGYLDEIFGTGWCEDVDYCVRAKQAGFRVVAVPDGQRGNGDVGSFPIYHSGQATISKIDGWQQIANKNNEILIDRYNIQKRFGNDWERVVIGVEDPVPLREHSRYTVCRQHLRGSKILELGCTSGYGTRYFADIPNLSYIGIDRDNQIIEFAKENFESKNVSFQCKDVNAVLSELEESYEESPEPMFDTIIAMEILEHLRDGRKVAQRLKKYCKTLFITVPFKEPVGQWGHHHVLHLLEEKDFPEFDALYLHESGQVTNVPSGLTTDTLLLRWFNPEYASVVAEISTKGRHLKTLPLAITALAMQTRRVQKILIYDDSDEDFDYANNQMYQYLLGMCQLKGISTWIEPGAKKGQVQNHNHALYALTDADIIWRLDDDNIPEPDVLEKLLSYWDAKSGAIGTRVWHSNSYIAPLPSFAKAEIGNDIHSFPVAWYNWGEKEEPIHVTKMYSTFIYNRWAGIKAGGYPMDLSPVGHHEDDIFGNKILRAGYETFYIPEGLTWHFREGTGGIRSYKDGWLWEHDDKKLLDYMWNNKIPIKRDKVVILNGGIGDHIVFKSILPEILDKYKKDEWNIILATAHADIFDEDVETISIAEACVAWGEERIKNDGIYAWMSQNNWGGSLQEAYRRYYL